VFNSGYFWSRFSCDLSPTEQVLSRAPDPGPAADVSQADQVPGHLSVEQHRPPAQTGNEMKVLLICFNLFKTTILLPPFKVFGFPPNSLDKLNNGK
jgi:hypothetical protein